MIDAIIIGIIVYMVNRGMKIGTLLDVFTFGGISLSLILSIIFSGALVNPVMTMIDSYRFAQVISFSLFFMITFIFIIYLGYETHKHLARNSDGTEDGKKMWGLILGVINGILISLVMVIFIAGIHGGNPSGPEYIQNSHLGQPIYDAVSGIFHIAEEPRE